MGGDEEIDLLVRQRAPAEQGACGAAEIARALPANRDQLISGLAHVVLRMRIGNSVREHLRVGCHDVRNAVGRTADLHEA